MSIKQTQLHDSKDPFYLIISGFIGQHNFENIPISVLHTIHSMYKPTQFLRLSLNQHCLFNWKCHRDKEFSSYMIDKMIERMYSEKYNKNSYLFHKNEPGNALYLIDSGQFQNNRNEIFKKGDFIGEYDLIYNEDRSMSFKAANKTNIVWKLTDDAYDTIRQIMMIWNGQRLQKHTAILRKMSIFEHFTDYQLFNFMIESQLKLYDSRNTIVIPRNSMNHDYVYVILRGKILVSIEYIDIGMNRLEYGKHEYFSWKLLTGDGNEKNAWAVTESDHCKLLKISYAQFRFIMTSRSMMDLQKIGNKAEYSHITKTKNKAVQIQSLSEIKIVGVIGSGSFGKIQLVRHSKNKQFYALKQIDKQTVMDSGDEQHILNEKAVLQCLQSNDSKFCMNLYYNSESAKYVYFLSDVYFGGDLFTLLYSQSSQAHAQSMFSKYQIVFYSACIVLALSELHKLNIIYRDLKLENLMIDHRNGYLKLIDFGFAKERDVHLSNTLCGTPHYLSPEIIQGWTQSFALDYWCLGIIIYEMHYKHPPFGSYKGILQEKPLFVEFDIDCNAMDIVKKLLKKNPYHRLGCSIQGNDFVKRHAFFDIIDFKLLEQQKLRAPFVPNIKAMDYLKFIENTQDVSSSNESEACDSEQLLNRF